MALDCEYTQPSRKTIQIGAAAFNPRNAALLERFSTYVDPGEPISPEITLLTGITNRDVAGAPTIQQAVKDLRAFHKKHKCFKNPIVWGSSTRNDSQHIWDESGLEGDNFMGFRVLDAKTIFQSAQLFEDGQHSGGLKDSMKRIGLTFEGEAHQAINDAINAFRVWYFFMRQLHDGRKK